MSSQIVNNASGAAEDSDDETLKKSDVLSKQLDPLKEDLADWLCKTLDIDNINKDNFFAELDNGVILCHLAQLICEKAKLNTESATNSLPVVRQKCFEKAKRRSFFSRDNVENFIKFCKSIGVHENLLFESNDLVLHAQPRNVILCLLEVSRIATRYGFEPSQLVQLEKDMSEDELDNCSDFRLSSRLSWRFDKTPPKIINGAVKLKHSKSFSGVSKGSITPLRGNNSTESSIDSQTEKTSITLKPFKIEHASNNSLNKLPRINGCSKLYSANESSSSNESTPVNGNTPSKLDSQVEHAVKLMQNNCNCSTGKCAKLSVKKVGEGKYNIAGRKVFVRLLNDCHMMVRVGGGWDTLDHFLSRHDPCQVRIVSRDSPERNNYSASPFLHIRGRYQSSS